MAEVPYNLMQLLDVFLDSSSSDSENDLLNEFLILPEDIPKVQDYIGVIERFSNEQFRSHFRIHWNTFTNLEDRFLESDLSKKRWTGGVPITPARNQLLIFLWFAANKCVLRDVSDRFNVAISTVHHILENVTDFLVGLAPTIISFPASLEEKHVIAEDFRQISGFPGVIGCIDGTYIPIRTPAHKVKSTYVNRHDITALTLQAICDANKRFLDVFTGVSSKIHDARVYSLSFISNEMYTITQQGQFHLLADSAYPLRTHILTPYKDYGNLTRQKVKFNKKLSQTRVKIENAFGLLKQRFRQLSHLDCKSVKTAAKYIVAFCVLHNICLNLDDIWENEQHDADEDDQVFEECNANARQRGEAKREHMCLLLNNAN